MSIEPVYVVIEDGEVVGVRTKFEAAGRLADMEAGECLCDTPWTEVEGHHDYGIVQIWRRGKGQLRQRIELHDSAARPQ